jgi:uncharacterized repeat protein (TIGR03833 family)
MNGQYKKDIKAGLEVDIILKQDQGSGKLTRGIVENILSNSPFHPYGIKVRLTNGLVGRVQNIIGENNKVNENSGSVIFQTGE